MKKKLLYAGALASVLVLSGCANYAPQGVVYTQVKGAPTSTQINDNVKAEKTGKSCVKSVFNKD
jgi:PBP1b-binding outer membrane lipoprotein LpoB